MRDDGVTAPHRITRLPIDKSDRFYAEYPAFKLGARKSVLHYAKLLATVAKRLILSDANDTDWVLTSPGLTGAPAGANLLCWDLYDLLKKALPDSTGLSLIDIRHKKHLPVVKGPTDLKRQYDYAKLDFETRVKERERTSHHIIPDDGFRNRAVIFVNDILVTGAHQHTQKRYFESVGAAIVKWLYIIEVNQAIGRLEPELEWKINHSSFDDFLHIVSAEEIQYTCKCIQRLFLYDLPKLEQILLVLDAERKADILDLAVLEGFDEVGCFSEKMALLREHCAQDRT